MKKQTLVILAVLALLLAACDGLSQKYSEALEESFAVGDAPTLTVDNFAGAVTVRAGESGTIRVVATKRAAREKDLDRIEVEMKEQDGGVAIETDRPSGWKNASVELEITAPANTRVDLYTGAGDVIVRDLSGKVRVDSGAGDVEIDGASGEVDAHTGAGDIDVRDASGLVRLDTGAGDIDYQGQPRGDCRFDTGAGSIKLRLPDDVNVTVDLDTGAGDIDVDMDVDGKVSKREVRGTIGSGDEGEIRAHTGAGDIDLISQ
jgi:DUF4097 and DUF4098 domain-containing protein YvlB